MIEAKKYRVKIKIYEVHFGRRKEIEKVNFVCDSSVISPSQVIKWAKKNIVPILRKNWICKKVNTYFRHPDRLNTKLVEMINKQKGMEAIDKLMIVIDIIC